MNWSDEHYVKLYTRETPNWTMLPWQSRLLLPAILRKADKAGLIDLGKDHVRALGAYLGVPVDFIEPGLAGLLESGTCELREGVLITPKFVEAQEARKTKIAASREYRDRVRDEARAGKRLISLDGSESRRVTAEPSCPTPARPRPLPLKDTLVSEHPIQAVWNEVAVESLPRWQTTDGPRLKHAEARMRERPDPEFWRAVLRRINASPFLRGDVNDFRATPDWLLKPANLTKILEGNYDRGPPRPTKGPIDPATQEHTGGQIAL